MELEKQQDIHLPKQQGRTLRKELKARHLTMISIGGSIGTGLFLGSGAAIHSAGPGGALVAYALVGAMVYFVMTSLGEMSAYMPTSGAFSTYGTKFVDPAFGFAIGWTYWFNWAMTIAAELTASIMIMKFWFPHSPSLLWSMSFFVLIFLLNYLTVRGYGEGEYWFSFIKVAAIILFIVVGLLMVFGLLGGEAAGVKNFTTGKAPFPGGFLGTFLVFIAAGFSFQGTEIVGVAAGESENPAKNVPKAIKNVFWRILLFYVLAILVIGLLVPYTNSSLESENVLVSPFTLVFKKAGLSFAASMMNAVILAAVLSAGNSSLYASTRMLYAMAKEGQAPRIFSKLDRRGVPVPAMILTAVVGMLAFFTSIFGDGVVYIWLMNSIGITGFIFWLGICVSHYRFRKAFLAQGHALDELPYRAKWYPFGPVFAIAVCLIVTLAQDYQAFLAPHINWGNVIAAYLGIPFFLVLWFGYKIARKTKIVPLDAHDFHAIAEPNK
ncbi:amino acid permease [Heyndrickxia coagulans]|uniref:Lysine-specific permease n=1 Tax=Heyndrickxia coagulans DSM 1 = ATCC 7050 TaxID=1121088 RepID=A0A8B4BX62_HEYCO|nr:amino acid permease [Heyndrickxia coagulans]AJH80209.1 amino acid permease family protein [Heyndrickxia coagulans DSM 1 = ATCC 7050]MCR2847288.1 amino acid permease [Heyndrickxia coagulans]MDR4224960.1 amino acid permease [Heyndrickxia coagulans DSM 1 = ATCC 7050]MEC5267930.1 amino acid permease [Heyndrickxia coagulans]MED4406902.1 amino acid permease [Heyndrickxia coagulans]